MIPDQSADIHYNTNHPYQIQNQYNSTLITKNKKISNS